MRRYNIDSARAERDPTLKHWLYNALDSAATFEIKTKLAALLTREQDRHYRFLMATQSPAFEMMNRGIAFNETKRQKRAHQVAMDLERARKALQKHPTVLELFDLTELNTGACPSATRKDGKHSWPRGISDNDPAKVCKDCQAPRMRVKAFNANSTDQVKYLLYNRLKLRVIKNKDKKASADKEALAKLRDLYPKQAEFISALLNLHDLAKQHGFLSFRASRGGRYPSNFSIGTAWTDRWSASKNPFQEGGNAQNITEGFRDIFEPDPGKTIGYADYKQGESNIVAHVSGDAGYIEAHKNGDVHTAAAKMIWPNMPWPGTPDGDKALAKQNVPFDQAEGHSFRLYSKKFQHGNNYLLSPYGISHIHHVSVKDATAAQINYFDGFPKIRGWHNFIRGLVHDREPIRNALGFTVLMLGRPWDDRTVRQALSFVAQSTLVDVIDMAVWYVQRHLPEVEMLAQIHDAILYQYPDGEDWVNKELARMMRINVPTLDYEGTSRDMVIDVETAVGKNWGHYNDDPDHGEINLRGIIEVEV